MIPWGKFLIIQIKMRLSQQTTIKDKILGWMYLKHAYLIEMKINLQFIP